MKYYLSSYKLGNETKRLKEIAENKKRLAFINNALDYSTDLERRKKSDEMSILDLVKLGFVVDVLDLKDYFNKMGNLEVYLENYDVIWARGGNTFVLAQAMRLSGFDKILKRYHNQKINKLYGGWSAGICILGPTLKGIHLVDDPYQKPYGEQHPTIWEGLGILDYVIAPHYKSDHKESADIDRVVQYLIENKILFKTMSDGEAVIIE